MTRPAIEGVSPFFILGQMDRALAFYGENLGFDILFRQPDDDPFFAIVRRDLQ